MSLESIMIGIYMVSAISHMVVLTCHNTMLMHCAKSHDVEEYHIPERRLRSPCLFRSLPCASRFCFASLR